MADTFDFGAGPVPAHRHPNGGGWVADTARVAPTAYVGPDARVYGSACVYGSARVSGWAQVSGSAQVFGWAKVFGSAWVSDSARVESPSDLCHGGTLDYDWTCWRDAEHGRVLRYGCETHPLSKWPRLYRTLSRKHEPMRRVEEYVTALRAIVALCKVSVREVPRG